MSFINNDSEYIETLNNRLLSLEERLADAEKRIAYLERRNQPIAPGYIPAPVFPINPDELRVTCHEQKFNIT